jgi:thiol-disulfide isomerase/thioredoxin
VFDATVTRGAATASKRALAEQRRQAARRRQLRQRGALTAAGVLVAGLLVAGLARTAPTPDGVTDPTAWDLPALDGPGRVRLADFHGRPTVAAFFAAWCHVCQWELPEFATLAQTDLGRRVNWVGIDMMDRGTGLGLAQATGIDAWPLARNVGGHDGRGLATALGARSSPMTVIYDSSGQIVDVTFGGMTRTQLEAKIRAVLGG